MWLKYEFFPKGGGALQASRCPYLFLIGEITNFGYRAPRVEFLGLKVRQNCGNLGYIISFYDALLYQGVPECYRTIIGRLHNHGSSNRYT